MVTWTPQLIPFVTKGYEGGKSDFGILLKVEKRKTFILFGELRLEMSIEKNQKQDLGTLREKILENVPVIGIG